VSSGSDVLKFIYVRVPRTASTSFVHYLETTFQCINVGEQHSSAIELQELWADKWNKYHTFGFIRNPWEWLVSMYNANLSSGAWGKEPLPGAPAGHMRKAEHPFDEWVKLRETTPIDWLSDRDGKLLVDEVRLFEDFVLHSKIKISNLNHPHYREWYDPELVDYVAQKCKREIEIGNYSF